MLSLIPTILGLIAPIINKLVPDAAAQQQLQAQLQDALLKAQGDLLQASKEVMVADAQQDDKFTKRARPSVVYWSMAFASFIAIAGLFGAAQPILDALKQIPSDLWTLMTVGIGAFGVSRGVEKGISTLGAGK